MPYLLPSEVIDFCKPQLIEAIKGGGNSQVLKITSDHQKKQVLKIYPDDDRNRGMREVSALKWNNGENAVQVPKLLIHDSQYKWTLLEYVEGVQGRDFVFDQSDCDQLIKFLLTTQHGDGSPFADASEACFSSQELIQVLEERRRQFIGSNDLELQAWLSHQWDPLLKFWMNTVQQAPFYCDSHQRWLTPSDIGFHNGLKKANGEWCFLDFEYFGQDDPAKSICDTLLHPAMAWTPQLQNYFLKHLLQGLGQEDLPDRIISSYPLHALNWALRVLNPLLLNKNISKAHRETQFKKAIAYSNSAAPAVIERFRTQIDLSRRYF